MSKDHDLKSFHSLILRLESWALNIARISI